MTLETFFNKFDTFADAPNAVAKMREMALNLAVQGKLVDRIASEGSGSEILKQANVEEYTQADMPSLPGHWACADLGSITTLMNSGWSPACETTPATKATWGVLKTTAVQPLQYLEHQNKALPPSLKPRPENEVKDGDILFTRAGPMNRVGILCVARPTRTKLMLSDKIIRFHLIAGIDPDFAALALTSGFSNTVIEELKSGMAASQVNISQPKLRSVPIPLPPLAEQKRIVAKVDELMALCDRLEAQQQERETRHAALARASLARFADAPTPANLNLLFHKSYTIPPADLRKSILTLAVQGKLVPQDPKDEPADDLLVRIGKQRMAIAKEQGVLPPKNIPDLSQEDGPHDIPDSWLWNRIGHIALVVDYGTSQKSDNDSSKVPVYRMGNISGGRLHDHNFKYVSASIKDLPTLYLKTDDILFNRTNSYELVGKVGIFTGGNDTATFASYLIRIRLPSTLLFPPFFSMAMNAPYFRQSQIEPEVIQQCGQANFNGTKLSSTLVPIPPLAEQRRIVAKVDELMALVDALETQLATARSSATQLLQAAVAELTSIR